MRRVAIVVIIVIALLGPQSGSAADPALEADVLRLLGHVPADTHLLLIVPSVQQFIDGISAFGRTTEIDFLAEMKTATLLEDSLGDALSVVREAGPAVLALSAERQEPLILAVVSHDQPWTATSDAARLDERPYCEFEGGCCAVLFDDRVAVFGRDKDELRRALGSERVFPDRLGLFARRALETDQVIFWVDLPPWQPLIQQTLEFVAQTTYMGLAAAGPDAEMTIGLYRAMFEQLETALGEATTYTVAVGVDAAGVRARDRIAFRSGGRVAAYLSGIKRPERDLLRGLPAGGTIVFACEWEGPSESGSLNDVFLGAMVDVPTFRERVSEEMLQGALANNREMNRYLHGFSGVVSRAPSGDCLLFKGQYLSSDVAAMRKHIRRGFEEFPDVMCAWGVVPSAELSREKRGPGEAEVDVYRFEFDVRGGQIDPMVSAMYGEQCAMVMVQAGDALAYAMGERDEAMKAAQKLADGAFTLLKDDARVTALFEQLSPEPQFCLLVDLPHMLEMMTGLLQQAGLPVPAVDAGSQQYPLAGLTGYIETDALRAELYVPARAVRAFLSEIEELEASESGAY